jgi:hypothetical protein
MVSHWDMSDKLGPLAFHRGEEHVFLGREIAQPRDFGEYSARIIDGEIGALLRGIEKEIADLLRGTVRNWTPSPRRCWKAKPWRPRRFRRSSSRHPLSRKEKRRRADYFRFVNPPLQAIRKRSSAPGAGKSIPMLSIVSAVNRSRAA